MILFRLYYISSTMMTNEFFDEHVTFCAKQLYDTISTSLTERIESNFEDPALKNVVRELNNRNINNT